MTDYEKHCLYDNFPLSIVAVRIILLTGIMLTGSALMYYYHPWAMIIYLVLAAISMYAILALVCRHCYYHGKRCDLSLGLLAGLLFKKGSEGETFIKNAPRTYPFLAIIALPPLIAGVIAAIRELSTMILLVLIAFIVILITVIVTTRELSCPHCKMQGICPFCMVPPGRRVNS